MFSNASRQLIGRLSARLLGIAIFNFFKQILQTHGSSILQDSLRHQITDRCISVVFVWFTSSDFVIELS